MIPESAFEEIIKELERQPLEWNKYRTTSGEGRSQAFGLVNRRCLPVDYCRQCWKRPYLYKLLLDFGRQYIDIPFTSITVNQNYKAEKHRDKGNVGESVVVSFGDFTGGELKIYEGPLEGIHDIRHKPIKADFSKIFHSVEPYTGTRYSLVFYVLRCKNLDDLPAPSVVEKDGKWVFMRGDEICEGLPHPLQRKKAS